MKKTVQFFLLSVITLNSWVNSFAQVIAGTYAIKNVQTGMLLRIKDANNTNGTPLVAWSPVNWKCVTWDFKHIEGETYLLRNLFTNKTFQSKGGVAADGAILEQQPLILSQVNQQYDFIPVEKNVYLIRAKDTDLYITPLDKTGVTDTGITLAKKSGSKLQQWTIYEQKPTM
jgi:Ricin-type beta-trefoil lectin domain-like